MTVRMATRADAVPDAPTEKLVEALTDARIVVTTDDLIGIAHQRVFEVGSTRAGSSPIIATSFAFARKSLPNFGDGAKTSDRRRFCSPKAYHSLRRSKSSSSTAANWSGNSDLCRDIEPKGPARQHHRRNGRRGLCWTVFDLDRSRADDQKRAERRNCQLQRVQRRSRRSDHLDHQRSERHQGDRNRHSSKGAITRRPDDLESASGERR